MTPPGDQQPHEVYSHTVKTDASCHDLWLEEARRWPAALGAVLIQFSLYLPFSITSFIVAISLAC
jgi:hypothetical protein